MDYTDSTDSTVILRVRLASPSGTPVPSPGDVARAFYAASVQLPGDAIITRLDAVSASVHFAMTS